MFKKKSVLSENISRKLVEFGSVDLCVLCVPLEMNATY